MTTTIPHITVDVSPPGSPADNDLWFDDVRGILFVRYNDGNSSQWVVANPGLGGPQGAPGVQGPPGPTQVIPTSLPPSGPAGGGLSGFYPNPTVVGGGGGGSSYPITTTAHGTVANGIVDDTLAFQSAIAAASGQVLYVPAGTYKVSLRPGLPYALLINSPIKIIMDPAAKIILAPMGSLPVGFGTGASNVIGVMMIQSSNVTIEGGVMDWNTANSTLGNYTSLIYATSGSPGSGGPYYNNVRINGVKFTNSRGAGMWAENTNQLWITNTYHTGGTGTDILVLRSLINLFDVHVDNNYIDSSTMPPVGGVTIQLSINFTGSAGLFTDRWSMNNNTIYAGLNTNVYYTMTQIYAPDTPTADGAWRRGQANGNILEGAIGGGGPLGGAEAISAVNVYDSTFNNNVIKNCYIGIEIAGQNCTAVGNTIDGGGLYMQNGFLMDGTNFNCTIANNTIFGFGGWSNFFGIGLRGSHCSITGNTISAGLAIPESGTGVSLYVDSENATLGDDTNVITGNIFVLPSGSVAIDIYDCSNVIIADNVVQIQGAVASAFRMSAPGTVAHATRDFIAWRNNIVVGGAATLVNQVASADWGSNIYKQTARIGP